MKIGEHTKNEKERNYDIKTMTVEDIDEVLVEFEDVDASKVNEISIIDKESILSEIENNKKDNENNKEDDDKLNIEEVADLLQYQEQKIIH